MAKILKNTTENDINHGQSGITLPAGQSYLVQPVVFDLILDDQTQALIAAGSLLVNDGSQDLTDPAAGWDSFRAWNF